MIIIIALIQYSLAISFGIQKTACSINLLSERSCGAYRLTGFIAVGMSTDMAFLANYMITFFVSLTLSISDIVRLLLIIFKYSVYLVCLNVFSVLRIWSNHPSNNKQGICAHFHHWEYSMFNISKNVLILKWKLATKFVTLDVFIDVLTKVYTTLKFSLKILNWI